MQTVDSVRAQTHDNFELLIVDDRSTDGGLEFVQEQTSDDSRIRVWSRETVSPGAPACRNEGLSQASGRFVIFLDSDDLLAPECLKSRLATATLYPKSQFWAFPSLIFKNVPEDGDRIWFHQADDPLEGFLRKPLWQTTSTFWRREFIRELGGFQEDLLSWQDWELHVRALASDGDFSLHPGQPDCFIRRAIHSRISGFSERQRSHLLNRMSLLRNTYFLLQSRNQLKQSRHDALSETCRKLASKLYRAKMRTDAERWINDITQIGLIDPSESVRFRQMALDESRFTFSERVQEFKNSLLDLIVRVRGN